MFLRRSLTVAGLLVGAGAVVAEPKPIPTPPVAITKPVPESIAELKEFQKQTRAVLDKVMPCTVSLQVGQASGSGVIVSKDGLILTAGHVSGEPNKDIVVIMPDGKRLKGKSLGLYRTIDSGMAKITEPGEYPFVEMGTSKDLKVGQWCVSTGHPGGFRPGRTPVVRVGRISMSNDSVITTDCTLVGGDSGGPLFDMSGKLIGIHSRIGFPITMNMHVPVETYKETWDQLVSAEKIGESSPWLGVRADTDAKECRLGEITKDSPAEKGGLKVGDIVMKFAGKEVKSYQDMTRWLYVRKPGDEVAVVVKRGDEVMELKITLGKRKDS